MFSCSTIMQYSLDYRKGFPTNNYPRYGCLQICFHKFKVTDFFVGFYVTRQGFIVACASHQKKKIAMAAQLNSILVQSYSLTD